MPIPIPKRIQIIKEELGLKTDVEFGRLAGASKGMVNHWLNETVKSIAPEYAYKLEENTGFSAKWIQLGEGPQRCQRAGEGLHITDQKIARIAETLLLAQQEGRAYLVDATQKDLDTATELEAQAAAHAKAKDC